MTGGLPGDPGTQAAAAATAAAATAAAAWTGVGAGEAGVDDTEDALLGVPLIEATGGISGMGLHQFSDNDKLSCIVKFLLKRDAFKEVSPLSLSLSPCDLILLTPSSVFYISTKVAQ